MMREQLDLHARWGDRKESVDECAGHAVECLRQLAGCDEAFRQWYSLGKSPRAERRFELTFESCRDLLAKGRNRYNRTKKVIEDLGYSMWLLNGWDGDSAVSVRFHAGAYPAVSQMPTPNTCVIELPYGGQVGDRIFQMERLHHITAAVVGSWDPNWARVSTFQTRQAIYPELYQGVEVGWLTYLSNRYGPLPKLPDDCEVTRIEGLGSLIVIKGIDRLTASNPAHVEAMRRLSEALKGAGLLTPTPAVVV